MLAILLCSNQGWALPPSPGLGMVHHPSRLVERALFESGAARSQVKSCAADKRSAHKRFRAFRTARLDARATRLGRLHHSADGNGIERLHAVEWVRDVLPGPLCYHATTRVVQGRRRAEHA